MYCAHCYDGDRHYICRGDRGGGGGTCQKIPRVDEMQGRSKICHGEVGKEEAEESLQSSEH